MPKIHVPKLAMLAACAVVSISALGADPTLHQVYQAAEAGNYREAQTMMDQVLRDHPNSAKAHFVEAELLAKQGGIANARAELAKAERLDPALAFAKPGSIQELKAHIGTSRASAQSNFSSMAPAPSPNIPWGMILTNLGVDRCDVLFLPLQKSEFIGAGRERAWLRSDRYARLWHAWLRHHAAVGSKWHGLRHLGWIGNRRRHGCWRGGG